ELQSGNPIVRSGHVLHHLADLLEDEHVDLLVVGARNLSPLGRLLGSTTASLLSCCPCSLLVVHNCEKS
ncbi:MAG: universal stress protein, partial [Planctomycetales bacterium]|nr:universal stress protein [Planctomycetales bacterium]